jgi:xylan 1,4-beta-xylosidase
VPAPAASVTLTIAGLPPGPAQVEHYRIDETHSNAYSAWVRMGSPQQPTREQYAALERSSELQSLTPARRVIVDEQGKVVETFALPRKSVSFVKVTWKQAP